MTPNEDSVTLSLSSGVTVVVIGASLFAAFAFSLAFGMDSAIGRLAGLSMAILLLAIPGFLTLKICNVGECVSGQSVVYSVGTSVIVLTAIGIILNTFSPLFGVTRPFSRSVAAPVVFLAIGALLGLNVYLERDLSFEIELRRSSLKISILLLCLVLFSASAAMLSNNSGVKLHLTSVVMMSIGLVLLFVHGDQLPKTTYFATLYAVSLSLIFSTSLASPHVSGGDLFEQYRFATNVISAGAWNSQTPDRIASLPIIVVYTPLVAILTQLTLELVFKVVLPLVFGLLPPALFLIHRRYIGDKLAFYSTFFYLSMYMYHTTFPSVLKQFSSEFFLVVFLLVLFSGGRSLTSAERFLGISFLFMYNVSHYATAAYFLFVFWFFEFVCFLGEYRFGKSTFMSGRPFYLFVMNFVFLFSWYSFTSTGSFLRALGPRLVLFIKNIGQMFSSHSDRSVRGATVLTADQSHVINSGVKAAFVISTFLIVGGFVYVLYNEYVRNDNASGGWKANFPEEYLFLSAGAIMLNAISFLPYVISAFSPQRMVLITYIVLTPFLPLGIHALSKFVNRVAAVSLPHRKTIVVWLMVFFILNSGMVHFYAGIWTPVLSFDQQQEWDDDLENEIVLHNKITNRQDVFGAAWIKMHNNGETEIVADRYRQNDVLTAYGPSRKGESYYINRRTMREDWIESTIYIYLGKFNTLHNVIVTGRSGVAGGNTYFEYSSRSLERLNTSARIYSNGGTEIYLSEVGGADE